MPYVVAINDVDIPYLWYDPRPEWPGAGVENHTRAFDTAGQAAEFILENMGCHRDLEWFMACNNGEWWLTEHEGRLYKLDSRYDKKNGQPNYNEYNTVFDQRRGTHVAGAPLPSNIQELRRWVAAGNEFIINWGEIGGGYRILYICPELYDLHCKGAIRRVCDNDLTELLRTLWEMADWQSGLYGTDQPVLCLTDSQPVYDALRIQYPFLVDSKSLDDVKPGQPAIGLYYSEAVVIEAIEVRDYRQFSL